MNITVRNGAFGIFEGPISVINSYKNDTLVAAGRV
jgi:hypothetical protein